MKILVTGGQSKFGSSIKKIHGDIILNPGRDELDLESVESVKSYVGNNPDIDVIIFNANQQHYSSLNTIEEFSDEQKVDGLYKTFSLQVISTGILLHAYKSTLKKVIGLTTGMVNEPETDSYVFGKELMTMTLKRLSHLEEFKEVNFIYMNPGGMNTEEEYDNHASLIMNWINKGFTENINSMVWIGDNLDDF